MSDVKINPNIRPIQPTKEQEAPRRTERTGTSSFEDTMAEIQKGTQGAEKAQPGPITDRASVDRALEQAATAHRGMMRVKELLEQQAARLTDKTDSSNKS